MQKQSSEWDGIGWDGLMLGRRPKPIARNFPDFKACFAPPGTAVKYYAGRESY